MSESIKDTAQQLVEQYLGLESLEVTEMLLDLCGATIDSKAIPLLKQRLHEEETWLSALQTRGYMRMQEKSQQLIVSLRRLLTVLEETASDPEENNR